jgi:hypothetical protein
MTSKIMRGKPACSEIGSEPSSEEIAGPDAAEKVRDLLQMSGPLSLDMSVRTMPSWAI